MEEERRIRDRAKKITEASPLAPSEDLPITRREALTRMGQAVIGGVLLGVGVTDYSLTQKEEKIRKESQEALGGYCEQIVGQSDISKLRRKVVSGIMAISGSTTLIFSTLDWNNKETLDKSK